MKKFLAILCSAALVLSTAACDSLSSRSGGDTSNAAGGTGDFPKGDVTCTIAWAEGGGCDLLTRPILTTAEEIAGVSIIAQNKAGGTGAVAMQYVSQLPADGYNILSAAENPPLYQALDISDLSYDEFEPIIIICDVTPYVFVKSDSKYQTIEDLMEYAKEHPGELKLATSGTGGMPWIVQALITAATGAVFTEVPYDGDAACLTAVLNGECDFSIGKLQATLETQQAGDIRYLAVVDTEDSAEVEGVPSILSSYPAMEEYLPWGPFYGLFVPKGVDQATLDYLTDLFAQAFADPEYSALLEGWYLNPLGLTGEDAKAYIDEYTESTLTALVKSGAVDKTLEELGVGS